MDSIDRARLIPITPGATAFKSLLIHPIPSLRSRIFALFVTPC